MIREVRGNQEGITYDDTEYRIFVSVTDDGQGNLVAKIKDTQELVFNNTYQAPTLPTEPDKEEPLKDGTTPSEPDKQDLEKKGTLPFAGIEIIRFSLLQLVQDCLYPSKENEKKIIS